MTDARRTQNITRFDLRWFLVSYCFFAVLHLLPIRLMMPVLVGVGDRSGLVWLLVFVGLVSIMIGRTSRRFVVVEPGLAGLMYALTFLLFFRLFEVSSLKPIWQLATFVMWGGLSGGVAMVGALLGNWLKRREKQ